MHLGRWPGFVLCDGSDRHCRALGSLLAVGQLSVSFPDGGERRIVVRTNNSSNVTTKKHEKGGTL